LNNKLGIYVIRSISFLTIGRIEIPNYAANVHTNTGMNSIDINGSIDIDRGLW
jgi:hypothetical protein